MFCPNCGRDCGNDAFCGSCGTNLRTHQSQWEVGMPCPHCGGMQVENGICTFCGVKLQEPQKRELTYEEKRKVLLAAQEMFCTECLSTSFTIEPYTGVRAGGRGQSWVVSVMQIIARAILSSRHNKYGERCTCSKCGHRWYNKRFFLYQKYKDIIAGFLDGYQKGKRMHVPGVNGSSLIVDGGGITICLAGEKEYVVPFSNLAVISHYASTSDKNGWFTLRDIKHRRKRIPKSIFEADKDRFTIIYDDNYQDSYSLLFEETSMIIAENRTFGLYKK